MRSVAIVVVVAAVTLVFVKYAMAADNAQQPISGSSDFVLSEQELKRLKDLAGSGDCKAALRVSHYYSFARNDFTEALPWLRRAALCPSGGAKAELVYMLLQQPNQTEVATEIDGLVIELKRTNAAQARAVEQEVNTRRASDH